jgi:hypothetical protein
MAVGIRIKFAGMTEGDYDRVNEKILAAGTPSGLIFHSSGPIDGGWGVLDFWKSRAEFDALLPHVQQAIQAAGVELPGPPDVREFSVYDTLSAA